jgi:NAD(P)-dependent dehydrogenase (short-subunit alcohol dehydrogenase family)
MRHPAAGERHRNRRRRVEKQGVRVHTAIVGRLDVVVADAGICAMGKGQTIQTIQSLSDTIDTDLVGVST